MTRLLLLDCDSTLSAIEGIDEMARLAGPQVFAAVEAMTRDAMEGRVPIHEVMPRRLALIQPGRSIVAAVAQLYLEHIEPDAMASVEAARSTGWTPIIVSGGFVEAIRPLADRLGITRIEAIGLHFDEAGRYAGFESDHPTTRNGGKAEIAKRLRTEFEAERVVMVGDGVSDLETADVVDRFVGFGRYTVRTRVRAAASRFIYSLAELPAAIEW
ncbi:MAG TPA: HAD-IB family phosphatase [Opitutaceae bacterium]|nr:HAD-IB family phosphatase [Opitutaceae bacterium]